MPVVCVLNQKGGVGKTSLAHHLAGTLARSGRRVLLVDADPQASLTQGFWGPAATRQLDPAATIAAILGGGRPYPHEVIAPAGIAGVDLVPGSRAAAEFNLPSPHAGDWDEACLRDFLAGALADYDLALVDCPPNLHRCSWAALVGSDHLVVPLQPEDYGAQGIVDVTESLARVRSAGHPVHLAGLLLTMVSARRALHQLYEAQLRSIYGDAVFAARFVESPEFPEAISRRATIAEYRPKGAAARAVRAIAEELLARIAAATAGGVAA